MDLRVGEENNSKIVISTSSGGSGRNNYFSEQALRAGLIANEIKRSDLMTNNNTDPLREAIQRELEKERIREEIIASEIIRRRELEAEVRRELAMERELGLRRGDGFSLISTSSSPSLWSDPRFSMLDRPNGFGGVDRLPFSARSEVGPFERLPFQRNPGAARIAESNKGQTGKVTIVAKPTIANLAGTKRKLTAADSTNDSNISMKKPQEWGCALCEVSATSEQGLNMHLQGKKHKAKEANLDKETTLRKGKSSFGKKNNNPTAKNQKKQEVQSKKKQLLAPELKKKRFTFWCEDCQIGCHSEKVFDDHCKGKKHIARMEELKQTGGTASSTTKCDAILEKNEDASGKTNREAKENISREMGEEEIGTGGQEDTAEKMEPLVDEVAEASLVDAVADTEVSMAEAHQVAEAS